MSSIRVAIVDDQQLVRAGFALVINSQPDMEVVLEAGDGAQAVRLLGSHDVDDVLMDVRMPNMDGLAATEALTAPDEPDGSPAGTPRRSSSSRPSTSTIRAPGDQGRRLGFLLKDAPPRDARRDPHRAPGRRRHRPSSTKRLISHLAGVLPDTEKTSPAVLDALTDREREVLVLMARGRSNQEIAAELYVAEATVKTHVGRVLAKLGARDRVQAVVVAYETGLVRPGT